MQRAVGYRPWEEVYGRGISLCALVGSAGSRSVVRIALRNRPWQLLGSLIGGGSDFQVCLYSEAELSKCPEEWRIAHTWSEEARSPFTHELPVTSHDLSLRILIVCTYLITFSRFCFIVADTISSLLCSQEGHGMHFLLDYPEAEWACEENKLS